MSNSIDKTGCVELYAKRIKFYAGVIVKTHDLGAEPGLDGEPWELAYQRRAALIYPGDLPAEYLKTLAGVFLGCAQTMGSRPPPSGNVAEDWRIVHAYFANGSRAIAEMLEVSVEPQWEDPTDEEPTTPSNVRFDILATYVTADAAMRLRCAGQAVADYLSPLETQCPLDAEQLRMLKAIATGRSLAQIAAELCFAERTLYRRLKDLYRAMKVVNREQAIAQASERGWL